MSEPEIKDVIAFYKTWTVTNDGLPVSISITDLRTLVAAAMGFDASSQRYDFAGTKTEITKQIGNAVP